MTKAEKSKAAKQKSDAMRKMRDSGMTYQEIADCFGVSRQCVCQRIGTYEPNKFVASCIRPVIFAGLRAWMLQNKVGYTELTRRIGKRETLPTTNTYLRQKLTGRSRLYIDDIEDILRVTGLTYEEAFGRM